MRSRRSRRNRRRTFSRRRSRSQTFRGRTGNRLRRRSGVHRKRTKSFAQTIRGYPKQHRFHKYRSAKKNANDAAIARALAQNEPLSQRNIMQTILNKHELSSTQTELKDHDSTFTKGNHDGASTKKTMQSCLDGFKLIESRGDGNCLYDSFAHFICSKTRDTHLKLRNHACDWIENKHSSLEQNSEAQRAREDAITALPYALFGTDKNEIPVLHEAGQRVLEKLQAIDDYYDPTSPVIIAQCYASQQREVGTWGNTIDVVALAWLMNLYVTVHVVNGAKCHEIKLGPSNGVPRHIVNFGNRHFQALEIVT